MPAHAATPEVPDEPAPRDIRQLDLVPRAALSESVAIILGCGAIGSHLGRKLAHVGVPRVVLVDDDVVSTENLALQGFLPKHLGRHKVDALAEIMTDILPEMEVRRVRDRCPAEDPESDPFRVAPDLRVATFSCVDSIAARRQIWAAWAERFARWGRPVLFADGRMAGFTCRTVAVDSAGDPVYEASLPEDAGFVARCTAAGTVFTADEPANQLGMYFLQWLNDRPMSSLRRDVLTDLTQNMMVDAPK